MSSTTSLILNVVVDDAGRYAKSRILERAGYRVLDAATGRDALRLIRDARPHLVVLDVGLPDMSGIDVCRQIKADSATADTLVLQVSASCVQPRDRVLGLEGGADVYLIEPVEAMELLAAVKALLRLSHREEEKRLLVAQLQEAHRSLSLAQRGSNSGVWDWDLTTGSAYVSPEYRTLYGLSGDEQVSYDTWLTLVHADDRQRVDEYGRRLFEAGRDYQIEFRILHPLKGIRWLSGMGTLTRDEEGRPVRFSGINTDVTDRKKSEEEREKLLRLVDFSTDFVVLADIEGRVTYMNVAARRMIGLPDGQDPTDLHVTDYVASASQDYFNGTVLPTVRERGVWEGEMQLCHLKTGASIDVLRSTFLIRDQDTGPPIGFGTVARDITARKRADERITALNRELGVKAQELQTLVERLRESEARIKLITDSLPVLISYIDASERYRFNNQTYERWFGHSCESITGKTVREVLGEAAYEKIKPHIDRVLVGAPQHFLELVPYKDVGSRHVDVAYIPDLDASRQVRGFFVMVNDMTEHRRTQEALADQLNLIKTMTDNTPSCLLMMDPQGIGTFANPAAESITGYKPEELVGHVLHEVIHHTRHDGTPFPIVDCPIDQALPLRRSIQGYEDVFVHKDGHFYPVRCAVRPILKDGEPIGTVVEVQDITKEKQAEDALRRLNAELEQRVEQRTVELVGSQERVRALAAELTLTEQRERQRLAGELHDYLAQLLVFGRIKMSQLKRTESSAATNTVAHEVDESLRQALTYTRSLVAELSPPILHDFGLVEALKWLGEDMRRHDMTVVLRCEFKQVSLPEDQAVLLFQSVRELLLNVSKHAGTAHAVVSVLVEQGSLHVHIVDEGRGFDPAAVGATKASATFGLFSIKERMSAMGGRFELASTPEQGTRATLILPLAGVEKSSELGVVSSELEDRSSESTVSGTPGKATLRTQHSELQQFKVRILLADDHAMLRQGLRTVLEGYADIEVVGEAADGEQAVLLARSLQPEVVVMDINMPAVDGIEATRQLKLEQPTITVIGLSVHNNRQVEQAMREAGATAFLTKEAAVEQLYQTIQTALR